jgi:MFS family permease
MRTELARLIIAQIFLHGAMSGLRVAAPLLALSQGASTFAAGALFATFGIGQIFLSVPAGRFADRHGLRKPVILAVIAAVASMSLVPIFMTYWSMLLACSICGTAVGSAIVALQRQVGRQAGDDATERKKVFSWLGLAGSASNFVGPVTAGLLIDGFGFRAAFAGLAVTPVITWLLVRTAPELPKIVPADGEAKTNALDLLKNAAFRRLLMCNWLLSSVWDAHSFMVPIIGHERGFSASTIGFIIGSFSIAATLVRFIVPVAAERLKEAHVISAVMIGSSAILAIYPFAQTPLLMICASAAMGFFLGATQPMMLSVLHEVVPEERHGEALGMRMAITNLASVLMPLGFGAVSAAGGAKAVCWGVSALTLSGLRLPKRLQTSA